MKYYCYDSFTNDMVMRNYQLVYLYHIEHLTRSQVSEIVGLAPSTVATYANKYIDLLDHAKELFSANKKTQKDYSLISDYSNRLFADSKDTNKFYLLRIVNAETGKLITSKIGTTRQPISKRVYQIKKDYQKMYDCVIEIEIKRVYDCKNITPICFESYFRYEYILEYTEHYVENDRFENIEFDYENADKIYNKIIKKIEGLC